MAFNLKKECTGCIVYTNSKEGSAKGNVAVAEIQMGDSSIFLLLSKTDKGVAWRPPNLSIQQNGHAAPMNVINGPMLADALQLAQTAQDRIKEKFGKTEFGKTYRIAKGIVEIIANPQ